ncbi:Transcription elongation factor S-II AltName: Full=TFIIS [Cyberlindnera jadinii]|uniref:Transcription elongation factor n=1 Tax=Cyberlindnera jadinii (strain ATCC 18201 / CBS 1600 / BCRC 20928 / JCM 3617 / NBRC 0987 / NRRL Y-1542) TaxID=983966 RepID=A0A0H5CDA1_CYBJN|nr:Transcription elongation factor S-II AltName: Full=TFIIS [Cyberlindnera jadinii]
MDAKEIKTHIVHLEKAKDDKIVLEILNTLKREIKPTEKLLRETKVGIAVNKHKSSENKEISQLVTKIIKYWRDEVSKEKKQKSGSVTAKKPVPETGSTTTSNGNEPKKEEKYVAHQPRNDKNDGVKTEVYENKMRNNCVRVLYNALCFDSEHPPHAVLAVAKDIEREVFKAEKMDTSSSSKYAQRLRTLTSNLRQKNNPELRQRVIDGELAASQLINMSTKELAPESLKKELEEIKKKNLFNAQGATQERAVTDRFTCGKCKEKKVSYYQLQTRSADEPLTTFCTCENCGNRWKFS